MSRTALLKIGGLVGIAVLAAIAGLIIWAFNGDRIVILLVILALFVPGRIQGYVYRDLFRGRRAFVAGDFEQAVDCNHRFLEHIRTHPWQKNLIWLSWTIYTPNVEAMALNNVGGAHLQSGDLENAEKRLHEALDVDPQYPLPYFNLAVIAELNGEREKANEHLLEAEKRGYTGSKIDQVISTAQGLLARWEG